MGDEHLSSVASQKISEWLRTLFEPGQVIELRGIRHNGGSLSGIYDFEQFGIMAMNGMEATLSGNFKGVYYTLNPLKQESLATASRIRPHSASDIDVLCRRWLLIDVDPKRPSGHSATDEEKANAKAKIVAIRDHLRHQNWPEPVFADSGNGFHLLYRIDLPADDGGLVKKVLGVLADLFDNEHVEVDRKVFNPSRITKLYGTKACKGPDIPERPHRWTSIIEIPGEPQIASKELLESLVSTKPAVSKPSTQNEGHDAAPVTAAPSSATSTQKQNQARAYLAKIPGAIEGQDGDKQTFKGLFVTLCG